MQKVKYSYAKALSTQKIVIVHYLDVFSSISS